MRKFIFGDLFEIKTKKGFGYFQYVFDEIDKIQIIRVLTNHFTEQLESFTEIVNEKEFYYIHFPLVTAFNLKLISFAGNYAIPSSVIKPKYMRTTHTIRGKMLGWHIVDTLTLKLQFVTILIRRTKTIVTLGNLE
ncbi:MAG: hypothetical protein M3388_06870 [Acidobacteriota bacterium]|nr:hypothetical protein [Acidobacteriota bacterium]